jgi:hypothetical protein
VRFGLDGYGCAWTGFFLREILDGPMGRGARYGAIPELAIALLFFVAVVYVNSIAYVF